MNRITRLGFALLLAATTLIPVKSGEAFCDTSRCFSISCANHVCPNPGQIAIPKCIIQTCTPYCSCFTPPA